MIVRSYYCFNLAKVKNPHRLPNSRGDIDIKCKEFRITTRKRARYAPESLCVVHVNKDSDSLKQ